MEKFLLSHSEYAQPIMYPRLLITLTMHFKSVDPIYPSLSNHSLYLYPTPPTYYLSPTTVTLQKISFANAPVLFRVLFI